MTTSPPRSGVRIDEGSVVAGRRGIPWWAAVALAVAMTGVGIAIDLSRGDTLTRVFLAFYAVGCVAAVLAVMYRGIFATMVQPPLVLAVAVPLVVKLLGGGSTGGLRNQVITLVVPLINGFPTMAVTTAATVALGTARIVIHRKANPRNIGPAAARPGDRDRIDTRSAGTDVERPARAQPARSPRRRP